MKRLVQLFKESNFGDYIYSNNEKIPDFDIHCPLLSLPLKFSTTLENIPFNEKYLYPNRDRMLVEHLVYTEGVKMVRVLYCPPKFKSGGVAQLVRAIACHIILNTLLLYCLAF